MVIVDKREIKTNYFEHLRVGDAFFYEDELFIKTNRTGEPYNAFRLHCNEKYKPSTVFAMNTPVQKVELEVIIHEEGWKRDYLGEEAIRKE